jgi:hypothetical protein
MNSHAVEFLARDHLATLHREAQAARLAGVAAPVRRSDRAARRAASPGRLFGFAFAIARELASASRRRLAGRESP